MNLKTLFIVSILAVFTGLSLQADDANENKTLLTEADVSWDSMTSADDKIHVSRKEIPGSDVVAFRGETIMNQPIGKIATVLNDTKRKTEWVHNAEEALDLEIISPLERYEYNRTGAPIVSDRDFVFHAKVGLNRKKRQMTIAMKSTSHPKAPKSDCVRGEIRRGSYVLTFIDPTHTKVEVELHADPKGSLPKWIVNFFQKGWPTNTLEGIERQAAKPDVIENADIKTYFEGKEIPASLKALVTQAESEEQTSFKVSATKKRTN